MNGRINIYHWDSSFHPLAMKSNEDGESYFTNDEGRCIRCGSHTTRVISDMKGRWLACASCQSFKGVTEWWQMTPGMTILLADRT